MTDARQQSRPLVLMAHDYPPLTGGGLAVGVRELARLLGGELRFRVVSSRLVDHFADDRRRLAPSGRVRTLRWLWEADVIVVHWTFSFRRLSTVLLLAAPLLGRPVVCVVHTAPDHCDYNRLRRLPPRVRRLLFSLVRRAARRCTAVVALSRSHAAALGQVGIPVACVLPLPVAPESFAPAHARRNARPVRTVGIVGELSELKGADAIPALLPVLTPHFAVRVAGRGSLAPVLRRAVAMLPPPRHARVVLSDRVEPAAMPSLYEELDCLLVLSRTESQSRVTLEAMLAGVVVLASGAGGVADLVEDGKTGFLVDPDDPDTVLRVLARLRADPVEAERIRRSAHERAARAFTCSTRDWRAFLLAVARRPA